LKAEGGTAGEDGVGVDDEDDESRLATVGDEGEDEGESSMREGSVAGRAEGS
jgi:hypothetical protein